MRGSHAAMRDCVVESHCPKIGVDAKPKKSTKFKTGKPLSERIAASNKKKKTRAK